MMAQGFGYDPGAYLTKSNPYAQMLMAQQDPNNGTVGGGLASAIRSGLMGLVMRGDQNREMAARQQQTDAMSEMSRGMAAQPWVNPDTGTVAPGQTNVGGYEGGIAALNRMGNNPYAGRLSSQLMMGATERRNELADAERARAQQLADKAAKFQQQKELEIKEAEVLRKKAKDEADVQLRAADLTAKDQRERERIASMERIAGVQIGAKTADLDKSIDSKQRIEGMKIGANLGTKGLPPQ